MPKYKVQISHTVTYECLVEADNEDRARDIAIDSGCLDGTRVWIGDSEFEVESVEEVSN